MPRPDEAAHAHVLLDEVVVEQVQALVGLVPGAVTQRVLRAVDQDLRIRLVFLAQGPPSAHRCAVVV